MKETQNLKGLVVKGAFFVILVYLLVYAYNTGGFNRLRKTPAENPAPMETIAPVPTPAPTQAPTPESTPSNQVEPQATP